ncbi:MAG: hypothetical protein EHM41_12280 [Chloroflexi bacterium]|nr:MAG: hypothetical protein EHM41_12280 [Chloroflexota bacterium]
MSDRKEQISPNFDLMLQSRDVSDVLLVETFLREFYPFLFRLGWLLYRDATLAEQIAQETLAEATSKRYTYWGEPDLRVWLAGFAIRSARGSQSANQSERLADRSLWKHLQSLPEDIRFAFILQHGFNFSEEEIAVILSVSEAYTKGYLDVAALSIPINIPDADDGILVMDVDHREDQLYKEIIHSLCLGMPEGYVISDGQGEFVDLILKKAGKPHRRLGKFTFLGKRATIPR